MAKTLEKTKEEFKYATEMDLKFYCETYITDISNGYTKHILTGLHLGALLALAEKELESRAKLEHKK